MTSLTFKSSGHQRIGCNEKGGTWEEKLKICILKDDLIKNRKESIDNFIYRWCDGKYNFGYYDDIITCMEYEGKSRIKEMKNQPHKNFEIESEIVKEIMVETPFGESEGSNKQYRYPGFNGWIHCREYNNYSKVHSDKYKPTNPLHLFEYVNYVITEKK